MTSHKELVREIIAHHLGLSPEQADLVTIKTDPHGGLSLDSSQLPTGRTNETLAFNIAHSEFGGRTILLVGVSQGRGTRIGVDVEFIRDDVDIASLAKDHFTPDERGQLDALPAAERLTAFYKCWTAKEAFVKALGLGVSFGLDQVGVVLEPGGARLVQVNKSANLANGWKIVHREMEIAGRPAIGAVAVGD